MRYTLDLSLETLNTLDRAAQALGFTGSRSARIATVIQALADNWDATQPDTTEPIAEVERRTTVSKTVDEILLAQLQSPDISLDLKTRQDNTTPRAADGLVPWDYIFTNYQDIDYVVEAGESERHSHMEIIREVFSKMPEDKWETEQCRSVISRAFERLG